MKKYLIIISAALLAIAGCAKFEQAVATDPIEVAAPSLSLESVAPTDSMLKVSIVPAEGTGFYSYVAMQGGEKTLDPETLLKLGYKSYALTCNKVVMQGCFNAAEVADTTFYLTGLTPNTKYTVYAIAASAAQGYPTEIVAKTVCTTDGIAPQALASKVSGSSDGSVNIPFDDPIELTDTAKVTACYLAAKDTWKYGSYKLLSTIAEIEVPADSISLGEDGASLDIKAPVRVPGAYVAYIIAEGSVVNALGVANEEQGDPYLFYYSTSSIQSFTDGTLYTQIASENFDIYPAYLNDENKLVHMPVDTVIAFAEYPATMFFQCDTICKEFTNGVLLENEDAIRVQYSNSLDASYKSFIPSGEVYASAEFGQYVDYFGIQLYDETNFGNRVGFVIEEGAFVDIWGNKSNAFSTVYLDEESESMFWGNYLYSYGYTLDDILGTYTFSGASYYGASFTDPAVVIATNEAEDSIFVYGLLENQTCCSDIDSFTPFSTEFEGVFNFDDGILKLDYSVIGYGTVAYYSWNGYVLAMSSFSDNQIWFQMPKAGTLNVYGDSIAVYFNGLGSWDYIDGTLTRTSKDYTVPASSAPVARQALKVSGAVNKPIR